MSTQAVTKDLSNWFKMGKGIKMGIIAFDNKVSIIMNGEDLGLLWHYLNSAKMFYEDVFTDSLRSKAFADIDYLQSIFGNYSEVD